MARTLGRRRFVGGATRSAVVTAIILGAAACSSTQPQIGSQGDLDSLVAVGGTTIPAGVRPVDTVPLGAIDPGATVGGGAAGADPQGGGSGNPAGGGSSGAGDPGTGASGNAPAGGAGTGSGGQGGAGGSGDAAGGGSDGGGTEYPPTSAVVDTPDAPASPFCKTLGEVVWRTFNVGHDRKVAAQDVLDDGDLIARFRSQAPDDGGEVAGFIEVIHRLANGESPYSALVTVPTDRFSDWARTVCPIAH